MTAPYVPTDWVDNTTPVDEARMDHMEAGIAAAVVMDSELAAATRLVANKLLAADANQTFRLRADGRMEWGAGGATPLDILMYRASADILVLEDRFAIIRANDLDIAFQSQKVGDAQSKFRFYANGRMEWGPGTGATDIAMYRSGAAKLLLENKFDPGSLNLQTKAGVPVDADSISGAQDGDIIVDTTNSRLYLRVGGAWHYCAINDGAAAGGADYEGTWAAGTAYVQGDVVVYNGVNYIAVNPSTGVTPSGGVGVSDFGTALPSSPYDGQQFTLVDSLTAPTYSWMFRYVAAKATNKWVFVGGAAIMASVAASESLTQAAYGALTTAGPSIVVPVAGDYEVELGAFLGSVSSSGIAFMSFDVGGTAAVDADGAHAKNASAGAQNMSVMRVVRKSLTAVTLTAKYRGADATNTATFAERFLRLRPVAVGG